MIKVPPPPAPPQANVNYETANDSLAVLIAASSSWAEDGGLIKVVLLEVSLPSRGGADLGPGFSQRFDPVDATVRVAIPAGGAAPALTVLAYVDANSDAVVVSVSPPIAGVTARLVPLRTAAIRGNNNEFCTNHTVAADTVAAGGQMVYHRIAVPRSKSYMAQSFKILNLPLDIPGFVDPLENRATGACLARIPALAGGAGMTFSVTVLTAQTASAAQFETELAQASAEVEAALKLAGGQLPARAHSAWWAAKWDAHTIEVSAAGAGEQDAATVSQLYKLQRFIELSQARSPYPIKFNGMLYTARRENDNTPWGGLNWWQNIRHPYVELSSVWASPACQCCIVAGTPGSMRPTAPHRAPCALQSSTVPLRVRSLDRVPVRVVSLTTAAAAAAAAAADTTTC